MTSDIKSEIDQNLIHDFAVVVVEVYLHVGVVHPVLGNRMPDVGIHLRLATRVHSARLLAFGQPLGRELRR